MPSLSSVLSHSLLLVLLLALSQESHGQIMAMVPEGLLDFVPEVCMPQLETEVLPCAIENLCFALLPTDEELAALPAQSDIQSCADVETFLCPITSRCPECKSLADDFFMCVILGSSETLSADLVELISACPLDCASVVVEAVDPTDPPETDAPTVAPTAAPVPDSTAPTDVPEVSEPEVSVSEDTAEDSGAKNMIVSSVTVVSLVTSFVLGW